MVEFFLTGRALYDLVKTKCIQVSMVKRKGNIYETFPGYDVSDSFPFSAYNNHILGATNSYIAYDLILLNKVIKVIPDLDWLVFKPVRKGS